MDGSTGVWILGGYQSDSARNLTKEGHDFAALTAEVVDATLASAKANAADIGVVHVGNAFGEMFAKQGHLGAMPATMCDGLWDTPASRHEAACASGSVAALADLRSGTYDTALVVGIELEKTVPYCLVFDAARVGDGPVCKLELPERISSGTHSTWASGSELRRWGTAESAADAIGL